MIDRFTLNKWFTQLWGLGRRGLKLVRQTQQGWQVRLELMLQS